MCADFYEPSPDPDLSDRFPPHSDFPDKNPLDQLYSSVFGNPEGRLLLDHWRPEYPGRVMEIEARLARFYEAVRYRTV